MNIHEKYISRCIELGKLGIGNTYPNPSVGSCIVYNNKIIGEGYTSRPGKNHAEINAINSVKIKSQLKESTLYVTLEPCSHHGKTPPCTNEIIKNKIPRVIIGTLDPHTEVSGKGIKQLEEAGIEVVLGVLENKCKDHHKRFLTFINKKRPYIILKWAETNDGFIAPKTKNKIKPVWISNRHSRQLVHKWRSEEQCLIVGRKTISEDNPKLTTRDWDGRDPIVVIISKDNNLNNNSNIFNSKAEKIIISNELIDFKKPIGNQITNLLYNRNIISAIVEGGVQTLQTFINENLWDEIRKFKSPLNFKNGTKAPIVNINPRNKTLIVQDKLLVIYNNNY
ncbi:MAG: bifunctional diaminohydroxyphosphoribosylaminopyrimidine deaminase/5-amino-6-(5-phosphoribosylamino)uracil reductase RibD [Flavobacteriaceae bacterium]|nr:bifunctional diaminohydroxyphosphoribosylaminopyrimidine deaminase/5-amino-6-(5-phosphoribosylamino)uracil reductase RibD [Flavobacteriaceae bacterium]MBT4112427.1 bifunctional diaminohydroxyphosphoribosylaminopyrimidine deaminase/5-amino-6-(5-phosphoribosylamino)uracil reductase RibD [Flavobacteriaceae bacterium]MBT4614281.1 bifunctional diaminohydroxyphosphoribosylaminopyrimidine deaminase/5-amino-6-(5-phosphoribosylamino)uracil reductase RibD [Flavobacteriaceae bacterium]MBT5246734.1 bifun